MASKITIITGMVQGRLAAVIVGCAAIVLSVGVTTAIGQDGEFNQPVNFSHTVLDAPSPVAGAVFGSRSTLHPGDRICTTEFQKTANVDTDCEKSGPSNETSIAVNPTNENNLIGGANDYQLGLNPGGQVSERFFLALTSASMAAIPGLNTRSCSAGPIRAPVNRRSRSTPPVTLTTRRSGSGSWARPT